MDKPPKVLTWNSLLNVFRGLGFVTVVFLIGAAIVTFVQLQDPPIAIEPFKISPGTDTESYSPESIADQVKSAIDICIPVQEACSTRASWVAVTFRLMYRLAMD